MSTTISKTTYSNVAYKGQNGGSLVLQTKGLMYKPADASGEAIKVAWGSLAKHTINKALGGKNLLRIVNKKGTTWVFELADRTDLEAIKADITRELQVRQSSSAQLHRSKALQPSLHDSVTSHTEFSSSHGQDGPTEEELMMQSSAEALMANTNQNRYENHEAIKRLQRQLKTLKEEKHGLEVQIALAEAEISNLRDAEKVQSQDNVMTEKQTQLELELQKLKDENEALKSKLEHAKLDLGAAGTAQLEVLEEHKKKDVDWAFQGTIEVEDNKPESQSPAAEQAEPVRDGSRNNRKLILLIAGLFAIVMIVVVVPAAVVPGKKKSGNKKSDIQPETPATLTLAPLISPALCDTTLFLSGTIEFEFSFAYEGSLSVDDMEKIENATAQWFADYYFEFFSDVVEVTRQDFEGTGTVVDDLYVLPFNSSIEFTPCAPSYDDYQQAYDAAPIWLMVEYVNIAVYPDPIFGYTGAIPFLTASAL